MKRSLAFLFLVVVVAVALAQNASEVPITSEPHHHLVLQNKYARVFQVEVPPHQATLMHRHQYDYAYVTIGAIELSNEVQGKSAADLKLQDGETRFSPGNFSHLVRVLGDQPFRNATVEFLQAGKSAGSSPSPDDSRGLQVLNGGTQDILFTKDGVRISDVQLNPGGTLPAGKRLAGELIVAVSELQLEGQPAGTRAGQLVLKPGEVRWLEGAPAIANTGQQKARLICFEFH